MSTGHDDDDAAGRVDPRSPHEPSSALPADDDDDAPSSGSAHAVPDDDDVGLAKAAPDDDDDDSADQVEAAPGEEPSPHTEVPGPAPGPAEESVDAALRSSEAPGAVANPGETTAPTSAVAVAPADAPVVAEVLVHPADRGLRPLPPEVTPGREPGEPLTPLRLWRRIVLAGGLAAFFGLHWRRWLRTALVATVLFVSSYVTYALFSWNRYDQPSAATHFVYLAHTFHACLDKEPPFEERCTFEMLVPPPHGNDWATWIELPVQGGETLKGIWLDRSQNKFQTLDGKLYIIEGRDLDHRRRQVQHHFVSFPPGPAVLMMPFVEDRDSPGVDLRDPHKVGLNDVKFTIIFASLNVVLMFFLLQRLSAFGVTARTTRENAVLTGVYALGSNVLWCSILGEVWFTALVVGMTFTLLYAMASIDTRHPFLAGLFLACALATRTPLAFSVVFFAYFLFFPDGRLRRTGWGELFAKGALFSLPILAVGGALMAFNYARFENVGEFGHTYLAHGQLYRIQRYGLFNYHFLSKNLLAAFTLLPRFQPYPPYVLLSKHGMSLFLSTPVFLWFLAFRSGVRRIDRKWFWALWLTVAAVAIPGMFYQNTGWAQYGFRFSLDYTPYLIMLLAVNRRRIGWLFCVLAVVGFVVNAFGAITFGRMPEFYEEWMIDPDR